MSIILKQPITGPAAWSGPTSKTTPGGFSR